MRDIQRYLLGVDLGAGSLKATLIDFDGVVIGEASYPIETHTPKPGWSEQQPQDWYAALCHATPAALAQARAKGADIAAIGVSGGAHIAVLTDAQGRVVRPALLWSDQRSAFEANELHERAGELIIERSLNKVNPTWTLPQLLWLRRHEPECLARTHRLFLAKDYLRYRLTNDWHTDFSDVVGALMADAGSRTWSPELCALIDWPTETLPPVVSPTDVVGAVSSAAATESSLLAGTPVVCGSNDTTVELFGAGAVTAGQGAIKLATAGVLSRAVDTPRVNPPISCYPHIIEGMYYTATGTNTCASAHRWLRDLMFDATTEFDVLDAMAVSVPPGADGLIFHPYLQGERAPYWDPRLRASFIGANLQHGRGHFVRALYEGIAFSIRDMRDAAPPSEREFSEVRLLGGGGRSAEWRQIISDVMGMTIVRPVNADASFGAALVAGVGVAVFGSPREAVERCVKTNGYCEPRPARHDFYTEMSTLR